MPIDKKEIENIAHLARLQLTDSELREAAKSISDILDLIDKMQTAATDNTSPIAHAMETRQRLRADVVTEEDRRDELQALAPLHRDGLYLVPKVID